MFALGFEKTAISRRWLEKRIQSGLEKRVSNLYAKHGRTMNKHVGKGGGRARAPHDAHDRDPFTREDLRKYNAHLRRNFPKVGK